MKMLGNSNTNVIPHLSIHIKSCLCKRLSPTPIIHNRKMLGIGESLVGCLTSNYIFSIKSPKFSGDGISPKINFSSCFMKLK